MNKKIVIYYEHINREYEACARLKKDIEKRYSNYEVYIFSIAFEYGTSLKFLKKNKIDILIMPWVGDKENYKYTQPFLEANKEVLIFNLHHEQISNDILGKVIIPNNQEAKNSVIHLVWAEDYANRLKANGVNEGLIFITGNIRNGNSLTDGLSREELATEFGLDLSKQWILFSENRDWTLSFREKNRNNIIRRGLTADEADENCRVNKESLDKTIEEFNNMSDEFFNEYEIIYRSHPGCNLPENMNKRVKQIYTYPIHIWFDVVIANVVFTSTSMFESDMRGIPTILYSPTNIDDKYRIWGSSQYQHITKLEELSEDLFDEYNRVVKPKKIYEKYIGIKGDYTIKRTADTIISIYENPAFEYSPKLIEYSKKSVRRILRREFITRILVYTNLLESIKRPYRSYDLRNDIPYKNKVVNKINNDLNNA